MAINKIICGTSTGSDVAASVNGLIDVTVINKILARMPSINPVLVDSDPSIVTITLGASTVSTKELRYNTVPNHFSHSMATSLQYNGKQARLHTTTLKSGTNGNIGLEMDQVQTSWEFYTDAQELAIEIRVTSKFTIQVDGVFYGKVDLIAPTSGSNDSTQLLQFSDRRKRRITINFSTGAAGFSGVRYDELSSVWSQPIGFTACIFADSFGTGTSPNVAGLAWTAGFCKGMGIFDYQISATGGTGIVANATNTKLNYRERLVDLTHTNFDMVVIAASINDRDDRLLLTDEITLLYNEIRAYSKDIFILVVGAAGSVKAESIEVETLTFNAFNSFNDPLVLTVPIMSRDVPPITGAGNVGATTGVGNADVYIDADATHYNSEGHMFHAAWLTDEVKVKLQELINVST